MKLQIAQVQALLKQEKPNPKKVIKTLKPLEKKKGAPWPVFHYMGVALLQNKEYRAAIDYFLKAINKGADEAETYHTLSVAFYHLEEYDKAETYAKEALSRRDDFFKAWLNLGSIYRAQARLNEALLCYQKANKLDSRSAGVAFRIGTIYSDQGNISKAEELFDITLQLDEGYLEAWMQKALIYRNKQQPDDARKSLHMILEKDKKHLGARAMLAEIFKDQAAYGMAVDIYEKILSENPKIAGIRVNYALCLQELGRFDESEKNYLQALDDRPDLYESFSNYLMGLHYNPKRTKEEIFKAHLNWDKQFAPDKRVARPVPQNKDETKRLRIGFISGGFRQHPVGWMITKALENLSKEECEIYCYTTNNISDPITRRIHDCSDIWRSVISYNDEITAKIIRDDEIDILVELSGHSADNRLKTVALEPAPIIVKWVGGLFNTSGLTSMDYLLSDWQETPAGEEQFYTEKLVRLPDDYICFLPPHYAPEVKDLPSVKNGYITFGCFNNPTKVNAEILEQWAKIMNKVPESRLFLKSKQYETALFTDSIVEQMGGLGISRERLIFEGQSLHDELLDSYNKVDIALDPWPYSGGLSTCEALWMGVPVVTLPGPTFAGRHAVTHLINAGVPELVSDCREEYIEKAVALASDSKRLEEMRSGLRQKVEASPLCDGERFGAHLGQAFREMWKQWIKGHKEGIEEWQDHIEVKSISNFSTNMNNGYMHGNSKVENSERNVLSISNSESAKELTENKAEQHSEIYKIETKDGIKICTPGDLNVFATYVLLEQDEWYEPELSFFKDYLKRGMNVLDIGSGFGIYALPMARSVGKEGRIYAFEPSASTRSYLEMSKLENEFDQLEIIGKTLFEKSGNALVNAAGNTELNRFQKNRTEKVSQTTLDEWWESAGHPDIDVIKLDVNGDELATLLGAGKLLQNTNPLIQVAFGANTQRDKQLIDLLCCEDYRLFEYVPGSQLLTDFDPEVGPDPYLLNIIAIRQEQVEKAKGLGLLFQEEVKAGEPEEGIWKSHLASLPWTAALMPKWEVLSDSIENDSYLRALDYICAANELPIKEGKPTCRSEKTALLLQAAQILIRLYNSGDVRVPIALTLARVLNQLGKRGRAVEILRNILEKETIHIDSQNLPFLPPLATQDNTVICSDIVKWLTVRSVEAWLTLKNRTTYFSEELELNLLNALEGNPEVSMDIEKRNILVKVKKGEQPDPAQINRVQKNKKPALNNWFWQSVLATDAIEEKTVKPIFSSSFWEEPFTQVKAEKIINFTNSFNEDHFTENLLNQVIFETEERLEVEPADNIAFFILIQALIGLQKRSGNWENSPGLEDALTKKGWTYKRGLYEYWFDKVEVLKSIASPKISAVIISNKLKDETLENIKKLKKQLDSIGEIIFVNNGQEDGEFTSLTDYIDVNIRLNKNSGAYLARNIGALFANGDHLLFVDDDGIPDDNMVKAHLDAHQTRDILVARGSCYSGNPSSDPTHYNLGKEACPAVTFLEGNASYRSQSFYQAGGWGDYILFGHGGMELSYRLLKIDGDKKKQVFIPNARLKHEYGKGAKQLKAKQKKQTYSFYLLNKMHPELNREISSWPKSFSEKQIDSTSGQLTPSKVKEVRVNLDPTGREKVTIHIPENELIRIKNIFGKQEYALPKGLKLRDNAVVVDIGANIGVFALYASRWANNMQIHCFEPNPQVQTLLEINTGAMAGVSRYYRALGESDGELELSQHPVNTGQTSTTYTFKGATTVKVPVQHAGKAMEEAGIKEIDVLKIDTEGAEVPILKELQEKLPDTKIVMAEYHTEKDRKDIEKYLSDFLLYSAEVEQLRGVGTVKYINIDFLNSLKN